MVLWELLLAALALIQPAPLAGSKMASTPINITHELQTQNADDARPHADGTRPPVLLLPKGSQGSHRRAREAHGARRGKLKHGGHKHPAAHAQIDFGDHALDNAQLNWSADHIAAIKRWWCSVPASLSPTLGSDSRLPPNCTDTDWTRTLVLDSGIHKLFCRYANTSTAAAGEIAGEICAAGARGGGGSGAGGSGTGGSGGGRGGRSRSGRRGGSGHLSGHQKPQHRHPGVLRWRGVLRILSLLMAASMLVGYIIRGHIGKTATREPMLETATSRSGGFGTTRRLSKSRKLDHTILPTSHADGDIIFTAKNASESQSESEMHVH